MPPSADITLSDDMAAVDWDCLLAVFNRTPLRGRSAAGLREVFQNSGVRCFAWDGTVLIGGGRAITDGVRYAVIFDVVVLPEYQGQGVGKKIMTFLGERAKAASILLYAVPGKEGFYEKLGYRKMKTAMALFPNPEAQREWGYID